MRMHRTHLLAIGVVIATTGTVGAQSAGEASAIGVTFTGFRQQGMVGPAVSRPIFEAGIVQGRWSAFVGRYARTSAHFACPSVDFITCDARRLGWVGTTALSVELGRAGRERDGGLFVAIQGGLTAMRWASGGVDPAGTGPNQGYRDYSGRTTLAPTIGTAVGVEIPLMRQPTRLQLGAEYVHERWGTIPGLSLSLAHRW